MKSLKVRILETSALMILLTLPCILVRAQDSKQDYQVEASVQDAGVSGTENGLLRIQDNASIMESDEVDKYIFDAHLFSNMAEKTSLKILMLEALEVYFPNLYNEVWEITGKKKNNYIAKFYGNIDDSRDTCTYTGEFILQPNFTIIILEDTIDLHPENGFCTYTTGEMYAYQGCYIEECIGSYYNSSRNNRLDVSFPMFYTVDNEWEDFNSNIWTGLENWFIRETRDDKDVSIVLDYEIKTCSDNLFSILFYGQREENGCKEDIAMALTVSVLSETLLSESMFIRGKEEDAFYDYYVDDGRLYSINSEKGGWKTVEVGKAEMVYYHVERLERHVYNGNGCWLGNCYYEVPDIGTFSEENKRISQYIREDLGRFLNETATVFEDFVRLSPIADAEYASEDDVATFLDGPGGYHCYVDTEITYNNDGILEVTYYYNVLEERGEAVAVYDLNSGIVVEHQDWQSDMIQKLQDELKSIEDN